jgi:hypothetical protein
MFTTTRRSSSIIRKLVDNDKSIGRLFNDQNLNCIKTVIKRNYIVKQNEWDSYGKDIIKTYMSSTLQNQNKSTFNYSINDAVMDTITTQTDDIKYIKLELISLNAKINKIINTLDNNGNKTHIFESEVKCIQKESGSQSKCGNGNC